jgi:uncharacterized membrane protein
MRSLTILMLGLTLLTFAGTRAHADTIEPDLKNLKNSTDKAGDLRVEIAASLNAPAAKVYDALTSPDKLSKYSSEIDSAKVLSSSATGKVVEYHGATSLNPNKKPFVIKYTFDPGKRTITAESAAKAPIQFHADYVLSPSKDGKSTDISYVSMSADPSKALGMQVPEFMRREAAVQSFMKNLINAGKYIESGGK